MTFNKSSFAVTVFLSIILLSTPVTGSFAQQPQNQIPDWIKTTAGWWADGSIDGTSFVQGIQYLIKEDILIIPETTQGTSSGTDEIPDWIKNNAGWWADGSIDESSFVSSMQFLIEEGVVQISSTENSTPQKVIPQETVPQENVPEKKNTAKKEPQSNNTPFQNSEPIIVELPNTERLFLEPETITTKQQKLIDKVNANGSIKVIIKLKTDFNPNLSKEKQVNQRANIKAAQNSLMNALSSDGITSPHNFKHSPLISMDVNSNSLNQLLSSPFVQSVSENKINKLFLDDTIPIVGADDVYTAGFDGTGQAVAILDTGIEVGHNFFAGGKVVAEACFTEKITQGGASAELCPNSPQDKDEVIGTGSAAPCSVAECDHGTHVAGIAAGNNGVGAPTDGVAKGANIIAIRVFTVWQGGFLCGDDEDENPLTCLGAFDSDIIDALGHVLELHNDETFTDDISSVNLSLGGDLFSSPCDDEPHKDIIDLLRAAGIPTIISSGNDKFVNAIASPACISSAISVGATDQLDAVPVYSNEASFLDLLAPGGSFFTDDGINSSILSNAFGAKTGTSMAAPHVTGAWALLKEANNTASVNAVLHVLKNTGIPILEPIAGLVKPRIQIDRALDVFQHAAICGKSVNEFTSFIFGTSGDDKIHGTSGNDIIFGLDGNDAISGGGGDDCIFGGKGDDNIHGGDGDDYLDGGDGADHLGGDNGADTIFGGKGDDRLSGGDDDVAIDILNGGDGNDSIKGGPGDDILNGGDDNGEDILSGGPGADTLDGGPGNDTLLGNAGADNLVGGDGVDSCIAGGDVGDTTDCEIEY